MKALTAVALVIGIIADCALGSNILEVTNCFLAALLVTLVAGPACRRVF